MRIGFISDIHTQLELLREGLALLDTQGVDLIVCLGDLIEEPKNGKGDQVVELLQSRHIPCVMGNHDAYTLGNQAWLRKHGNPDDPAFAHHFLKPETIAYLNALVHTRYYEWDSFNVVLNHGTMWSLHPQSPPHHFAGVAEMAGGNVILLGHTHHPLKAKVYEQTWILNPGSVTAKGSRSVAILELPTVTFDIYDIESGNLLELDPIFIDRKVE